jgi:hypothetical protein
MITPGLDDSPPPLTIATVDPDVMEALGEALDVLAADGEASGA